jgi:cytochrome P450/nitrite reductase/ring-hydroxylating ferredoxin subunit
MSGHIAIAHLQDLAEGKPFPAQVEGVDLVVIRWGDGALVLEGRCPHQGTLLAEGFLDAGALVCRAHGWRFDCASGARIGHPGVCLQMFPARVDAGSVLVERDVVLAWKRGRAPAGAAAPARPAATSLRELPGPTGLPFLGNLWQLDLKRLHLVLEQWCAQFGPIYAFRLGTKPVVVVAEPTLIAAILRDRPETYRRLGTIEAVFKDMGVNGVFSAEGDDWRRQRRLVMEALDTKHLRQFFPTLIKVTRRLKRRWDQAAASRQPLEVQKDLMRYAVDVTASLVLGYDMNTLEQEGDVIQQHLEMILPMINRRINAPFRYWRYWKLPADRALDAALVAIRKASAAFVAQARDRLARVPELAQHPTNLLESMLAARDDGDNRFTDEELFGNILTMLLAGEDTTANTIAWMIHFMTEHPDVQRRMQAEADDVLGTADVPADVKAAEKLAYIEAVANEAMRLKPVAPIIFLETNEDVAVGGVQVPPGTSLFLLTRVGGLQAQNFTKADAFRPERWLADAPSTGAHNRNVFMPFGMGPRFCPGRNLALLEIKTALGMVCRGFDLARAQDFGPTAEAFAFTMMPTNLSVLLRPRGGA